MIQFSNTVATVNKLPNRKTLVSSSSARFHTSSPNMFIKWLLLLLLTTTTFERALSKRAPPTFEEKQEALKLRTEGEKHQQAGEMQAATKSYLRAYKIQPVLDDPTHQHAYLNNIGWTLHQFNPRRARKFYKKAIKQLPNPPFPHAYLNLGDLCRNEKKFIEAAKHYTKAIKIKPTPSTVAMLGQLHMWNGELDMAIKHFDDTIKLEPSFQEVHNYYGQAFSLKREWKKASKAFINTVRHGLPTDATGCYRGHWQVMESWSTDKGIKVTELSPPSGSRGKFVEPFSNKTYRDQDRKYKLIRLKRVHVEGKSLTRVFQGAPRCVHFVGEHLASGAPPWNWGISDESQPPVDPPKEIRRYEENPVVNLFDRRSGHGNYYHHQMDLLTRALWFFRDVYRPREKKWKNVKFLIPPGVLLHFPLFDESELFLRLPKPDDVLSWEKNDRFYFKEMYTVDWTAPLDLSSTGVVGNQPWTKMSESIFQVHFPPRALVRLAHDAMRTSIHVHEYEDGDFGGRERIQNEREFQLSLQQRRVPKILWYSRSDMEKRHVVGEERVIARLRTVFGPHSVEIFRGGIQFDIVRNMRPWGAADIIIGPHGAGLVNMLMAPKGTSVVLLPSCDERGCPSAADSYFGYLASALGFDIYPTKLGPFADFFRNYTMSESDDQVDEIVEKVKRVLVERGLWSVEEEL